MRKQRSQLSHKPFVAALTNCFVHGGQLHKDLATSKAPSAIDLRCEREREQMAKLKASDEKYAKQLARDLKRLELKRDKLYKAAQQQREKDPTNHDLYYEAIAVVKQIQAARRQLATVKSHLKKGY